jgi:hypothetical protein
MGWVRGQKASKIEEAGGLRKVEQRRKAEKGEGDKRGHLVIFLSRTECSLVE